jgi:hypothetical protein
MTEWELQDQLTVQWIKSPLQFQGTSYFLVAWELMFPSWEINNNKKKWNEVSVDFILFDGKETFLCLELKNILKGQKPLLAAYCQAVHRSNLFATQYHSDKIAKAHFACFDSMNSYRIREFSYPRREFIFPTHPTVKTVLAAREFPSNNEVSILKWNEMDWQSFKDEIGKYVATKEMNRMMELGKNNEGVITITV